MVQVVLYRGLSQKYTGGQAQFEIEAQSVRDVIETLEKQFPGLGAELELASAVAIDGEIYQDAFFEPVKADSEVYFLPRIGGG